MVKLTLLFIVFACSALHGQNVSGDLKGRLQTVDGTPVEGATIRVSGPFMQTERISVSLANGSFAVLGLPVGEHQVSVTHISYRERTISAVRITLGGTTNLGRIEMEPGDTSLDTLVVTGSRIPYKSEFNAQMTRTTMDNLPLDRDYKSAITMLPQVNASYFGDGLSINGSTGAENMFFLNGVNITDNFASAWSPTLSNSTFIPYNFIKEVSVKQSGYSAEYGRAIGGVVDVVTQSGTNAFKGQGFAYYSGSFLNANPKSGLTGATIGKTSNYDLGFSVGGPIIKDKLWYFAAYSFYENTIDTQIGGVFFPDKTTTHFGTLKLDWQASKKTKLDLTLLADPTKRTPVVSIDSWFGSNVPAVVENPDAMWARTEGGGLSLALNGKTQVSENTMVEYGVNGFRRRTVFGGATTLGDTTRQYYDLATQTISGGIGYNENFSLTKGNARMKVTHVEVNHTIRAGMELEYNRNEGPSAGKSIYKQDAPYDLYMNYNSQTQTEQASTYQAVFLQHDWQLTGRVLLELGLRWERQDLRAFNGNVLQSFENQWQPRVGLNWFLDADEKQKLSFNYGRVYQAVPLNFGYLFPTGTQSASQKAYSSDPRVPGTPSDSTIWSFGPEPTEIPTKNQLFNTLLSDQFAVQYTRVMGTHMQLSARILWKTSKDPFIINQDSTFAILLGNPGRGDLAYLDPARHDYTAAELGLSGSLLNNRFTYNVFYVWSRTFGNYVGIWDQEVRFYSLGSSTLLATTPERRANQTGLLPSDRTHSLKVNGSYRFGFGLTVGANFTIMRGTPLNEFTPNIYGLGGFDLLTKRGSSGRLPVLWDLSFRFVFVRPNLPYRISLDVFRVGNSQAVVDQVQQKFTDPGGTNPNPAYGQPVRRQQPMAVRLGIEYNF